MCYNVIHEHSHPSHPRQPQTAARRVEPPATAADSELVRESLRRYIVTEQLKAIRRVTVPLAEAQGFLTDEDVFKEVS